MKRPCIEDMELAAEWLSVNEGADGESEACSRVATWLVTYARESAIRAGARKVGCTVQYFKKHLSEKGFT